MHPHQGDGNQGEQQPEATLPDAGQVVQRTESYRQDEAAETADQSDDAADGADTIGVIDRDVLEHRRLAEAHEEAEYRRDDHEPDDPEMG